MKTVRSTFLFLFALSACGIFNVGSTNEDGTPKTAADARMIFRAFGDAALRTWVTDEIHRSMPQVLAILDTDGDGVITLAETENAIDLSTPDTLTLILVTAIQLLRMPEAQKSS